MIIGLNILEMIIEGHTVDTAVLRDIVDRDLRDRLLKEQVLQGLFQRSFGYLGHAGLPLQHRKGITFLRPAGSCGSYPQRCPFSSGTAGAPLQYSPL